MKPSDATSAPFPRTPDQIAVSDAYRALKKCYPDFESVVVVEPFAYLARDKTSVFPRLICPACAVDVPEEGYEYLQWFEPNPKPMSESDALGWAEGDRLVCDSCSQEIGR